MGAGFSLPQTPDTTVLTSTDGGNQTTWDHWGYVPEGVLHPAQHLAALSYRDTGGKPWTNYGAWTRAMQPTQIFGKDLFTPHDSWQASVQNGYVKTVLQPFKATGNSNVFFATSAQLPLCTPDNFPNCSFDQISQNNMQAQSLVQVQDDFTLKYLGNVISDQVDAYRHGELTYVDNLNSQDTSTYVSACDGPSLLDEILPVACGAVVVVAKTRFLDPELVVLGLPSDASFALTLNAYLAGYYLGKQAILPFGQDEANGYKAAMCIARGAGYVTTSYFVQNANLQPIAQLGVSLLSAEIVANVVGVPLAVYIDKAVGLTSAPMRAITSAWRTVQSWLCHWSQGTVIACDDAKAFPDARRWSIAELAAKLTDELCAEEGWQRNSPHAQYAMKAFLASPTWVTAGMNLGVNGEGNNHTYDNTAMQNVTWNLAGEVVQTSFWGGQNAGQQFGISDVQNPDVTSVNNDASGFANANMIACQNYDILMAGTGQGTAGADPALAMNFATNLKRWKESVRKSAWDPSNWVSAEKIGLGALSGDDSTIMSPQQFLANCNKSFANGGFDDFESRGLYAQLYKAQNGMSDEDWMLIQINQYLAGGMALNPNISTFASRLRAAGVTLNLCGCIAYMAQEPENGPQRIFWREWIETEDAEVKACFGLFHKDLLQPPLLRAKQLPTLPPALTPLQPLVPKSQYANINAPQLAQLQAAWNTNSQYDVADWASQLPVAWTTINPTTPNLDAFDVVRSSYYFLQTTDINDMWDDLTTNGIFDVPNKTLGIPQGYAMIYAIMYVRPPWQNHTELTQTWDAFVGAISPANYKTLTTYPNPFALENE